MISAPLEAVALEPAAASSTLLIGLVSKRSGVPIKTIRYYEEIGLVQSFDRTQGGFRLFSEDVLTRLQFIRRSQGLGLSLAEIKELLDIHDQGKLPCDRVKAQLQQRMTEIDRQIHHLLTLKQSVRELLDSHPETIEGDTAICPLIEQAASHSPDKADRLG